MNMFKGGLLGALAGGAYGGYEGFQTGGTDGALRGMGKGALAGGIAGGVGGALVGAGMRRASPLAQRAIAGAKSRMASNAPISTVQQSIKSAGLGSSVPKGIRASFGDATMNARIGTRMMFDSAGSAMRSAVIGVGAAGNFAGARAMSAVGSGARRAGNSIKSTMKSIPGRGGSALRTPTSTLTGRHNGRFIPRGGSGGSIMGPSRRTSPRISSGAQSFFNRTGARV